MKYAQRESFVRNIIKLWYKITRQAILMEIQHKY